MKLRFCMFSCDGDDGNCGEESPPEASFTEATKAARRDGWLIVPARAGDGGYHLCSQHNEGSGR